MKNEDMFSFNNPSEESLWNLTKPKNPWTPNTELAWNKLSVQLGVATVSASLLQTAPVKAMAKLTLKKLLLWSAIGVGVTTATVIQISRKENKAKTPSPRNASAIAIPKKDTLSAASDPTLCKDGNKTTHSTKSDNHQQPSASVHKAPNSKILQFKQTELSVVTEILSQTYGVTIKIEKPQLLHCKLTATFENEPLNTVLEIIQETFNMEIVPEKETIWLKGGSCQ